MPYDTTYSDQDEKMMNAMLTEMKYLNKQMEVMNDNLSRIADNIGR